jgi:UDP-glucuronate 4-epimerase
MKILVTGAAGFIGFHVVNKLLAQAHQVTGIDNINDYYDVNLKYGRLAAQGITKEALAYNQPVKAAKQHYTFIQLDIADQANMQALFETYRFDAVVNLAAQAGVRYSLVNPQAYTHSNVTGFLNVLEGCRATAVKHLVYASSSSVYGLNTQMPLSVHASAEHPISLYAATKKANEMMAHTYSHLFGLPTTGIRFFTVYGPWGRPDMAPILFADAIVQDKPIKVFNHGHMLRDFTYVSDITEGVYNILLRPATPSPDWNAAAPDPAISSAPYRIVNIGNARPVQLLDFIAAMEQALGKEAIKEMLPIQPGDVPATHADVGDLIRDYDYRPSVNITEGVQAFIQWYRSYYGA